MTIIRYGQILFVQEIRHIGHHPISNMLSTECRDPKNFVIREAGRGIGGKHVRQVQGKRNGDRGPGDRD